MSLSSWLRAHNSFLLLVIMLCGRSSPPGLSWVPQSKDHGGICNRPKSNQVFQHCCSHLASRGVLVREARADADSASGQTPGWLRCAEEVGSWEAQSLPSVKGDLISRDFKGHSFHLPTEQISALELVTAGSFPMDAEICSLLRKDFLIYFRHL